MAKRARRRTQPEAQQVEGKIRVTTTIAGDEETEQEVEVLKFESDPAYVRVSVGETISPRQYESVRVDVAITMPCYPELVDETYEAISDRVIDLLEDTIDKLDEAENG